MVELQLNDSQMRDFENRSHVWFKAGLERLCELKKGELNLISDSLAFIQNYII